MAQHSASRQLTFASLDALSPCVVELRIANISALLKPGTATSATTAFASLAGSALGTPAVAACRGYSLRLGSVCE